LSIRIAAMSAQGVNVLFAQTGNGVSTSSRLGSCKKDNYI